MHAGTDCGSGNTASSWPSADEPKVICEQQS